jgi:hypothetical protein
MNLIYQNEPKGYKPLKQAYTNNDEVEAVIKSLPTKKKNSPRALKKN